VPTALSTVTATVGTPAGKVRSAWKRDGQEGYLFELEIPEGVKAAFSLPKGVPGIAIGDLARTGILLTTGKSSITITSSGEVVDG
jgi:hypothetical protein